MVGPSADLTTEWEGGSLSELVSALQSAASPVRIEVIAPGTTDSNAGEVHLLAGGLADAFAGSLRRDDAMAALQRLEGARYVVEARLPDPETGSLSTPGPHEGSLKGRPVAALMRYCEDYVLTCRVEVWRGQERAVINYRRGEIISTSVGGGEGSERLPEVMAWTDGSYEIVLPAPVLPPTPSRKGTARSVEPITKGERKRHSTLPLVPGSSGAAEPSSAASAGSAGTGPGVSTTPSRPAAGAPALARPAPVAPAQAGKPAAVLAPASPQPARPEAPAQAAPASREGAAKPSAPPAATASRQPAAAQPSPPSHLAAAKPPAAPPARPAGPAPAPVQARLAGPGSTGAPATASRAPVAAEPAARQPGALPVVVGQPPAQQVPAPQSAQAPQQTQAATPVQAQGRPNARPGPQQPTAEKTVAATQGAPTQPAATAAKPHVRTLTPAMGSMPGRSPVEPLPSELTTRGTPPVPAVPLIPAPPARPASHPTPPPITQAKPAGIRPPRPAELAASGGSAAAGPTPARQNRADAATPSIPVPVALTPPPFHLAQPAQPAKQQPPASNDLKPASGTIEAKRGHAHHLPPAAAPVEIADQPELTPRPQPGSPAMVPSRPLTSRRARVVRKGLGEQPVRVYIMIGLAIGAGIVVAYWAYWYLPLFHH